MRRREGVQAAAGPVGTEGLSAELPPRTERPAAAGSGGPGGGSWDICHNARGADGPQSWLCSLN